MNMMLLLAHASEVGGHRVHLPPLHPILVNFSAALLPTSLISDLLGRLYRKQSLTSTGWWSLFYAGLITPFTVIAGWIWRREMAGMDMPQMAIHQWLGTALAVVFVGLVIWRWRIHNRPDGVPSVRYLIACAGVVAVLVFQAHIGGSMSFGSAEEPESIHKDAEKHDGTTQPSFAPSERAEEHQHEQWRDHIDVH